ncbi:MAG: hypothetical protein ABJA86_09580 [Nocardioidaceae bacterium]
MRALAVGHLGADWCLRVTIRVRPGVRRRAVTLVIGATSRTKVVDVAGGEPTALPRLLAR